MEKDKKIRFIDSQYQTLFYIPDGANIALTYSDGETAVRPCKFIDDYHTQIGHTSASMTATVRIISTMRRPTI